MLRIDLTGRVALVTGGSGELGRAICRTLADCGADVAIAYRSNGSVAEELAHSLRNLGIRSMSFQVDVTSSSSVQSLGEQVRKSLGSPQIVVANAVSQYDWKSILDQPMDDFLSQYRSCVEHLVHLAKEFAPAMMEQGHGRIVAINTECAMQCGDSMGAYASAKRAMDGIARVLAKELGPSGVTVNQVAPGWTLSDRLRNREDDPQADYKRNVPLRRAGEDTEIAAAVAFLSSDLASFITGVYLPVCGGNVVPGI